MNLCLACKNKSSTERCTRLSIRGLAFCGTHARCKIPRLWANVHGLNDQITQITKVWRGYRVRRLLRLAGPGVLRRSVCHNDEELVLLEDRHSVSPLDYFAFEENGKVWWFDVRSMIGCLNSTLVPMNPYTRQPLSMDTRFRLRLLYKYRIQNRLPTLHQPIPKRPAHEVMEYQWMRVCQVLHENGFDDFLPNMFLALSPTKLYYFLLFLRIEIAAIANGHLPGSRYRRFTTFLSRDIDSYDITMRPHIQVATTIMVMYNTVEDMFPICVAVRRSYDRL